MAVKVDEKNDIVLFTQEEYQGLVSKIKEIDMRLMKVEREGHTHE